MPREKCVYCKRFFNNTREQIIDDWDRLCEWCLDDFEGTGVMFTRTQSRKE